MHIINKQHVPSGSFFIAKKQPMILQAFLGTCVGVAISSEDAGMGGIIHLLLPEPVSSSAVDHPEKYASTGLPLFLEALEAAGVNLETARACIAGGALVGPIDNQDLDLDIGGRTTEIVEQILADKKIPVTKSETGGFFSCSLNLNLGNFTCSIEPAGFDKLDEKADVHQPSPAEIKKAMDQLKPIPQVALKILRIIEEGNYDIERIASEVRKDQVISAQTLKLCNSAMFARQRPIESLDHALVFLGQDQLVKLVISAAVERFFSQPAAGYSLCKGGLYYHAIGTAMISEEIARQTKACEPAVAYTAGLLHDIGKVVLDQYVASTYPLFYRQLQKETTESQLIEKQLLSVDHTEVGYVLAQNWKLPQTLAETVRHHHKPEKASLAPEVVAAVYLANLLMSRFHTGLELSRVDTGALEQRLAMVGLGFDRFHDLIDWIPSKAFHIETEGDAT